MYPLIILLRLTSLPYHPGRTLPVPEAYSFASRCRVYRIVPAKLSASWRITKQSLKNPALAGPRYIKTKVNAKHAKYRLRRFEYIGIVFS